MIYWTLTCLDPKFQSSLCGIVQGVGDHLAVILEVDWEDTCTEPQVERLVPVYNKTDVSGLENFLSNKFVVWACNGSSVEEIWKN